MIRIISLTDAGQRLAECIAALYDHQAISLWHKPQPFAQKMQQAFLQGDHLLCICATGIIIRTLAPVLASKHDDPPVIAIDEQGHFVVPLLSGHEGGANQWASELSEQLAAQLVITTAKPYLQPIYTVGMGCERHCPQEDIHTLLLQALELANITLAQVHSINSIDIKADEQGLILCAQSIDKLYQTFDKKQLHTVEHLLHSRSEYVYGVVGVYGVAESAALFAAQQATDEAVELLLPKIKSKTATCAIAKSYPDYRNEQAT